jgi:protein required for attachment to host cells
MSKLEIPHDAFVFVSDGRKALCLRNADDEKFLNSRTERVFVEDNPPTHEQGSDRPGRAFSAPVQTYAAALKIPIGTSSNSTASLSESRQQWNGWCATIG